MLFGISTKPFTIINVGFYRQKSMWCCSRHILIIAVLLLVDLAKWNDNNVSPTMGVNAFVTTSMAPNDSAMYNNGISKAKQLWSKNGVRSLIRRGRNVDPLVDSEDLPSCVEACLISNCYESVPLHNTVAPVTIP